MRVRQVLKVLLQSGSLVDRSQVCKGQVAQCGLEMLVRDHLEVSHPHRVLRVAMHPARAAGKIKQRESGA